MLLATGSVASAQNTKFTYQGRLQNAGIATNGQYDMQFKLFDTETLGTGTQQGGTVAVPNVQVTGGIFAVQIDFGSVAFDGSVRFLEIAVKLTSESTFTTLDPRQLVTSTPYAVRSLNSTTADGLSPACVNCVTGSQIQSVQGSQVTGNISGSQINGAIPVQSVPAGSASYIQNTSAQQISSNFNIAGTGIGNIFDATLQFNLGGNRVLSNAGTDNLVAGVGAGMTNASFGNSLFGKNAGQVNMERYNSFFGFNAGVSTTTGCCNSMFGNFAGFSNVGGRSNVFMGGSAGFGNTGGNFNVFLGDGAGFDFFTSTGNTTGSLNTFVGYLSGKGLTTGSNNTFIGYNTTGISNLDHATVIGADATVNSNNTVVLGRSLDTVQVPGALNTTGSLSANILNATTRFDLGGSRILGNTGTNNLFAGIGAGSVNTGSSNSFFGRNAGINNSAGSGNVLFGVNAGAGNTTGNNLTIIGGNANVSANNLDHATAIGADATVGSSNTVVLGRSADTVQVPGSLSITGAFSANILNATTQYNINGSRVLSAGGNGSLIAGVGAGSVNTGLSNSFFGNGAGQANTSGAGNSFFGVFAGDNNIIGNNNTFIGISSGFITANGNGNNNTTLGTDAVVNAGLTNATAIGSGAYAIQNNTLVLGSINGSGRGTADTNVGIGTNNPLARLHVRVGTGNMLFTNANCPSSLVGIMFTSSVTGTCTNYALLGGDGNTYVNRPTGGSISFREGNFTQLTLKPGGIVAIEALGTGGGSATLCRNSANEISSCGSSSLRYKTAVLPFTGGLEIINRLRPISFTWKQDKTEDIGLGAEDVEKVEPLLTFRNQKGEIEGVKYNLLNVVLINAVKQQQEQIQKQQREIDALTRRQQEFDALKKLVCADHPDAAVCKSN
jgi:hypothetical protein